MVCANNLTFYVDHSLYLYIDGVMTYNGVPPNADAPPQTVLPNSVTTIAIQATNDVSYGGILASDTDGRVVTSGAWRCTANLTYDMTGFTPWYSPLFNDSSWPAATEIAVNDGTGFWKSISAIRTEARWIWTAGYTLPEGNASIYCRYKVRSVEFTTAAPLATSTGEYPQHCPEQPHSMGPQWAYSYPPASTSR